MIKIKASLLLITRPLSSIKIIKLHNGAALKTQHLKKVTECKHWWSCLPMWQGAGAAIQPSLPKPAEGRATRTQQGPGLVQITRAGLTALSRSSPHQTLCVACCIRVTQHQNHLDFHRDGFWCSKKICSVRHFDLYHSVIL